MPEITADQLAAIRRATLLEAVARFDALTNEPQEITYTKDFNAGWDAARDWLNDMAEEAGVKKSNVAPAMEWRPAKFNGEILYVGNEWVGSVYQIDYVWQANCAKGTKADLGLFMDIHTAKAAVEKAVRP